LRDAELKYNLVESKSYALVKALKSLRIYILHSQVILYVPTTVVMDILVQPDIERKRVEWIAKISEYDFEIRPTKLIKSQGLAHLLAKSNCQAL
jgi:hypothetical protein